MSENATQAIDLSTPAKKLEYVYKLVSNFEPAAREEITHSPNWHYKENGQNDINPIHYFLKDLKKIYSTCYLPARHPHYDDALYERDYKKLPKKYRALFIVRPDYYPGAERFCRRKYVHPAKYRTDFMGRYLERPEWTVILRNKADKAKFLKLRERLESIRWDNFVAFNAVFSELAEMTTVKYIKPLWNRKRDLQPDHLYEEYKAEKDAAGSRLRMMKEKHRDEEKLYNDFLQAHRNAFLALQKSYGIDIKYKKKPNPTKKPNALVAISVAPEQKHVIQSVIRCLENKRKQK